MMTATREYFLFRKNQKIRKDEKGLGGCAVSKTKIIENGDATRGRRWRSGGLAQGLGWRSVSGVYPSDGDTIAILVYKGGRV